MKAIIKHRTLSVKEKIEVSAIAKTLNLNREQLKKQCENLSQLDADDFLTRMYTDYIENNEQRLIYYAAEIRHYEDVYKDFRK